MERIIMYGDMKVVVACIKVLCCNSQKSTTQTKKKPQPDTALNPGKKQNVNLSSLIFVMLIPDSN
jgi:hypothetical protein